MPNNCKSYTHLWMQIFLHNSTAFNFISCDLIITSLKNSYFKRALGIGVVMTTLEILVKANLFWAPPGCTEGGLFLYTHEPDWKQGFGASSWHLRHSLSYYECFLLLNLGVFSSSACEVTIVVTLFQVTSWNKGNIWGEVSTIAKNCVVMRNEIT